MTSLTRRLAGLLIVVALVMGAAIAQDDHSDDGEAEALTMNEAMQMLTRSGRVPLADEHDHDQIHVDVLYAHPIVYRSGGNEVPEAVYEGDEVIVFVTENIHAGEFSWDPVKFDLYVDGRGPIAPVRSEQVSPDPHHRATRHHYRLEEGEGPLLRSDSSRLELRPQAGSSKAEFAWDLPLELGEVRFHGLEPTDEPLDLSDAPVLRVEATEDTYVHSGLVVPVGEPVVVLFRNDTDDEHHFHVLDLAIDGTMRWLQTAGEADLFTDAELRQATQLPDHICDSDSGICPTGQSVHLHANPHGSDAIAFVPKEVGTFEVVDPLFPERSAEFEVVAGDAG
ncbi:MAG: hypothetical protein U5K81_02905 [Trueperaceae bacterium]|nr:hypothetical protein [Trueperaceae bacterium]